MLDFNRNRCFYSYIYLSSRGVFAFTLRFGAADFRVFESLFMLRKPKTDYLFSSQTRLPAEGGFRENIRIEREINRALPPEKWSY